MAEETIYSVLVVDDDALSRKKLCRILQRLGIENIKEAEQGDQVFSILQKEPVNLVLADWHMPGLNGLELLKAIRADQQLSGTAMFLVTAEGRQAQIVAAIKAGATGYIMKPFSQESIKQQIGSLLPKELCAVEASEDSQADECQPRDVFDEKNTSTMEAVQPATGE